MSVSVWDSEDGDKTSVFNALEMGLGWLLSTQSTRINKKCKLLVAALRIPEKQWAAVMCLATHTFYCLGKNKKKLKSTSVFFIRMQRGRHSNCCKLLAAFGLGPSGTNGVELNPHWSAPEASDISNCVHTGY